MLKRPIFHPHFHVEIVAGEGVFLLSGSRQTLLRGRLYELLAPWLDGRSAADLCEVLRGKASLAEVCYALEQMERKDYLCEMEEALSPGEAALWSCQQIPPTTAARRLAECAVVVNSFSVEAGPFLELLKSLHVRVAEEGPTRVVLTDDYLNVDLKSCNAEALRRGQPWLLVIPVGRQIAVGPLFLPGRTGCWECLAQRVQSNSPVAAYLQGKNGATGAVVNDRACTPATAQIALALAANAIASWIVRGELPELEGKVKTLDVPTWRMQSHTLIQLPFCPACGNHSIELGRSFVPPVLVSCQKTFTSDGGHRAVAPEETFARYGHHVSPITGAVPLLEKAAPASDGVLHVYVAGNNMSRAHHNLAELRGSLRSMSGGKGASDVQARASGLCEGLERYSGVFRGDEPRRLARQSELGGAAIAPADCLLFSDRQYRERDARNAAGSRFTFIPVPFDPKAKIDWSPVWSLTRNEVRYLPTAFCYYNYPQTDVQTYCLACSNGNAAGNTLEEAMLQGFLELVERDSVALWWYNRVSRPGVDLDSFNEPYLGRVCNFLQGHGRDFWVLDLTADLRIPVFAAICRRTNGPSEQIVLGFGAHFEPRVAVLRAVTEMNQMLSCPLLEPEGKQADDRHADPETAHWLKTATTANQPYLLPAKGPDRIASSYAGLWTDDMAEDVRACQALVERLGLEMLVLDQTRPEVALPVVKVIVPGLRHFWPRFAAGRLYNVPVQLNWLPRVLTEEELNPIAMFL